MKTLLFIDLETTGLDPEKNTILEIAVGIAEVDDRAKISELSHVQAYRIDDHFGESMSPQARDLHKRTGRIQYSLADADEKLVTYMETLLPGKVPMPAGNNVHFDVAFVKKHLPRFAEKLHYRTINATTIRELFNVNIRVEGIAHTAEADMRHSHAVIAEVLNKGK